MEWVVQDRICRHTARWRYPTGSAHDLHDDIYIFPDQCFYDLVIIYVIAFILVIVLDILENLKIVFCIIENGFPL